MKIKINGEFTKEELQEKLKEFDKPVWEIKINGCGDISLFKGDENLATLLDGEEVTEYLNLSTVSRDIAIAMGDLVETKDVLDKDKTGYQLFFNSACNSWEVKLAWEDTSEKHFKTEEIAILAMGIINKSVDMKTWIKRMSK